jgi:hypothetical protein
MFLSQYSLERNNTIFEMFRTQYTLISLLRNTMVLPEVGIVTAGSNG